MDYVQLGYLLGLIAQGQNGEPLDISVLGPTAKAPVLEGVPGP